MGYGVDYTPEQLAAAKVILRRPKLLKQLYPPEILALVKVSSHER